MTAYDRYIQQVHSPFVHDMVTELASACDKNPSINSLHEGYAVILEELDEVWREVKLRQPDKRIVYKELVQVAAMAWRMAMDCGLVEP